MKNVRKTCSTKNSWKRPVLMGALFLLQAAVYGQDGNAGINEANQKVRSYFASGTNLMYAVGAIVVYAPVKLTTVRRFKLTRFRRLKLTTGGRSKLTI